MENMTWRIWNLTRKKEVSSFSCLVTSSCEILLGWASVNYVHACNFVNAQEGFQANELWFWFFSNCHDFNQKISVDSNLCGKCMAFFVLHSIHAIPYYTYFAATPLPHC